MMTWTLLIAWLSIAATARAQFTLATQDAAPPVWAEFNRTYHGSTLANGTLNVYKYRVRPGSAIRVRLESRDARGDSPLLAVFRERTAIVSVQLPIVIQNYMFDGAARTLCPFEYDEAATDLQLSVEMSSYRPVNYNFSAEVLDNFILGLSVPHVIVVSPSEPVYFLYEIPSHLDSVVVSITSPDTHCTTVSIQPVGCPVFDLENNVIFTGVHQTMTKKGSVTIERREMPKFYVILIVHPNDNACNDENMDIVPINPRKSKDRRKNTTIEVTTAPTQKDYFVPVIATLIAIACVYMFVITFVLIIGRYEREHFELNDRQRLIYADDLYTGEPEYHEAHDISDDASIESYDYLADAHDKEVRRAKVNLTVADLALKSHKDREKKYKKYIVSLLTIALFYGLPVVQLVLTWQDTVRLSGDLDLCWYNFRCARPFLGFFAFNNIFSNIAYVSLGMLLIVMVKERSARFKAIQALIATPDEYGLPQHNGLLYAIGLAVVMEGVMSASYHICPSSSNYQFDTAFMYIIGMLGMLKIYQLRHPDINANAHVALVFAAFAIFTAMCGVYFNDLAFWALFSVAYVVCMLAVSIEFYFKGLWRFNPRELLHIVRYTVFSSRRCSCLIPTYKSRFLFLLLGNLINLAFLIVGVITRPRDFASFLLFPFVANLFLYLVYYLFMKLVHGERIRPRAVAYLVLTTMLWTSAAHFFMHNVTDWSVTPAASRELNRDCVLMDFYDNHDVWHFLSSLAIFSAFSLISCVDDDLHTIRRDRIAVF